MIFVANFIRFSAVQKFQNRLRFDKVTDSLKVGTLLRHSVERGYSPITAGSGIQNNEMRERKQSDGHTHKKTVKQLRYRYTYQLPHSADVDKQKDVFEPCLFSAERTVCWCNSRSRSLWYSRISARRCQSRTPARAGRRSCSYPNSSSRERFPADFYSLQHATVFWIQWVAGKCRTRKRKTV